MEKIPVTILAIIVVILLAIAVFFSQSVQIASTPNGSISNAEDTEIRSQVSAFGTNLKNVSLLAPEGDVKAQLDQYYGPYITSALLTEWKNDPSKALGRTVSSPWPDRIEIGNVIKVNDNTYRVEGNVIELSSADRPLEPAGVYPVTLTMNYEGGRWLVASVEKGAYSQPPQRITVTGLWECLPHKNTSGPQTLECAFGIAVDQSDAHYAIDTRLMSTYPVDFPTGTRVRVEGIMTPVAQLSSDHWQKYPIDGIISATSITKI